MAICRLAMWAFRDKQWPYAGTSEYDLREMIECAEDYQEWWGMTHWPVDNDIRLDEFVKWARGILAEQEKK